MPEKKHILPVIVFSQFCCTSLWFAGNGVMDDLLQTFNLDLSALGHLTSAVQFGFITGTLVFAFLNIADRFSPSKVFFYSAVIGAFVNLGMIWEENNLVSLLLLRFFVGVSLAGIYPVGMKIASDYYQKGLGTSLGFLVGALVLGTAFPHLLKTFTGPGHLPWRMVLILTSALAALGGLLILFLVPNGPYRSAMLKKDFSAFFRIFKLPDFRAAAFGYFGHMWELYAFWAFVPVILSTFQFIHPQTNLNVPLLSFIIIGIGGLGCIAAGYISRSFGTKKTAATALSFSGACCVLSPVIFLQDSQLILLIFLIFWGLTVVADSPLFSTLVAQNAPAESRGTALTIVNSVGFAITIVSIQLINLLLIFTETAFVLIALSIGPIFGLTALFRKKNPQSYDQV